jgi:hypothetical protein
MENFKTIDLQQSRDFSRKMNATFEFIRQNFKPLVKSILFIAGPPVLIASVLIGTFMGDFMQISLGAAANPEAPLNYFSSPGFWLQLVLMLVFLLVAGVMTIATINNYIVLYDEKKSNQIEVQEVWDRVRDTFWMHLGTVFFFLLLAIAVYIVLLIPIALFAAISPFLIFFGFIFFVCGLLYITFSVSLTFFIRLYEKKGFFESIARSYKLVQGKWWSTFGLILVLYLIAGVVSYLPMIPVYIMMFVSAMHNTSGNALQEPSSTFGLIMTICFSLYYLINLVLQTLPNIGIAFQYFNLVELKEARGLINQIDTLGAGSSMPAQDEHY